MMGEKTAIEWTDSTWNPIRARNLATGKVGWHCEHITPGCEHCYAEDINKRLGTGLPFKPGHRKDIEIFLDEKMLLAPLRWKTPRMIFVCSMTDTFADFVKDEWLDRMFAVMVRCPQHTFQVLTKRTERMWEYLTDPDTGDGHINTYHRILDRARLAPPWPLPNVWLGASAEDQLRADKRLPLLLDTPAAVRFASLEPLLSAIDLSWWPNRAGLDWVIVGGESGPHARPMHPRWARSLRDQCKAAGVPFFFKQWGNWTPYTPVAGDDLGGDCRADCVRIVHRVEHSDAELLQRSFYAGDVWAKRVGKKAAGRLLDGVEHNGMPR